MFSPIQVSEFKTLQLIEKLPTPTIQELRICLMFGDFGGEVKLPETHEELVDILVGGNASNEHLLEIAMAHSHRDGDCEVCGIEDFGEDFPLLEFIFENCKETISTELLEYLADNLWTQADSGSDGGGHYQVVMFNFGIHPMSSERLFRDVPWWFEDRETMGFNYGDEPNREVYEKEFRQVTQHPLASEEVVKKFLDAVHRMSEMSEAIGCLGSVEACEACNTLVEEHWEN